VARHTTDGASGKHILALREKTANTSLHEYVLEEGSLDFVRRICNCYRDCIVRGTKILRFEQFADPDGSFRANDLLWEVVEAVSPYLEPRWPRRKVEEHLDATIRNSRGLKGHSTGGKTQVWRTLPRETQEALSDALEPEILLLGY
jgi:hypothetical protein